VYSAADGGGIAREGIAAEPDEEIKVTFLTFVSKACRDKEENSGEKDGRMLVLAEKEKRIAYAATRPGWLLFRSSCVVL
jgi:hypothetical protein